MSAHPAWVTADRLASHREEWGRLLSASEKEAFALVIDCLRCIADETGRRPNTEGVQ